MKKSIFKIIWWVALLFVLVIIIPALQFNTKVCTGNSADLASSLPDSILKVYFIGSSRTKAAVNDDEINEAVSGNYRFINLGIASSTISQHYYLARHISNQKGKKILFVEMSGFRREHSANVAVAHYLLRLTGSSLNYYKSVDSIVGPENSFVPSFKSYQRSVFNTFKIAQVALKSIIGFHPRCENHFGYKPLGQLRNSGPGPLLRPAHFEQYASAKTNLFIERYIQAFKNLEKSTPGLKIIFILPFTSYREMEREQMIPSYLKLDSSDKVAYPQILYDQINDSTFLADNNHLNQKGAKIYTEFFTQYLTNNLSKIIEAKTLR